MKTIEDLRNHSVYKKIEQHPDLDDKPLSFLEEEFLHNEDVRTSMEKHWDRATREPHLVYFFTFLFSKHEVYWWDLARGPLGER